MKLLWFIVGLVIGMAVAVSCGRAEAAEICLSEQDASLLILEYERGQICKVEVVEWEQYSLHKEQELQAANKLADLYKEQVVTNEQTIQGLRALASKPEPKLKILLSPALYIEARVLGSTTSDFMRGGVKLDILKAWGAMFYAKAEANYRDDARTIGFGAYVGVEWKLW